MATTTWNQDVNAGSDWEATINLMNVDKTNRDLTGCTLESKARRHYSSSSFYDIGIEIIDETLGTLKFYLSNTQTTSMNNGKYLYDVELTTTGTSIKERVIQGVITVRPEVT